MRKTIDYLLIYIVFCLLQFSFGKYLNIYSVFPNFILILIVYLGLSKGSMDAQLLGFLFGLTWDVFSTDIFGIRAIMFTFIGYFIGILSKKFDRSRVFTQCAVVLFASVIYWIGFSFAYYVIPESGNYTFAFFTLLGIAKIIVTVLIAPAVFYFLDIINYKVHREL
jgi:rod shape-determining protein MreD